MIVRDVSGADTEPVAALTNRFIRASHIHFGIEPTTADEVRASWEAERDRYPWLSCDIDGRFAGFARAGPWRSREAYRFTAETAVYVEEDARRRGVARALYTELLARLTRDGFHLAVAGITLPNEASVALHEHMGFTHVGTFRECGWKIDRWWDVGFWQRPLSPGVSPA